MLQGGEAHLALFNQIYPFPEKDRIRDVSPGMQSDSSQVSEGSQVEGRPGGGGESLPGQGDGESRQGEKIFPNFCPGDLLIKNNTDLKIHI